MTLEELIQRLEETIGTIDLCDDDICEALCEYIRFFLVPDDNPVTPAALTALSIFIAESIDDATVEEQFGYAAQLQRFSCLVDSLTAKLRLIPCNCQTDTGTDLLGTLSQDVLADLICVLTEIVIELIALALKLIALNNLIEPCETGSTGLGTSFKLRVFNCLMCDFVDELCRLEKMISDLGCILRPVIVNMFECTPCYVAKSSHREPKHIVQANCTCNNDKSKGCSC